jgi:hypothetical protein
LIKDGDSQRSGREKSMLSRQIATGHAGHDENEKFNIAELHRA